MTVGVVVALAAVLLTSAPVRAAAPAFRFQDFPRGLGESLAAHTGTAYDRAAAWFGTDLEGPVIVRWVSRREDLQRLGVRNPDSVAGVARSDSGLIALYAPALGPRPERIRGVILHEICHLFVAKITRHAELEPPRWLNEGIAMWVSGEWDLGLELRSDHASLMQDAIAASAIVPMEELDTGFPEGRFFHVAYAQSLSFVEWMVRQQGEDSLLSYLRQLDQDLDPEPAFRRIYGMSFRDAELAWRDELLNAPLSGLPSARTVLEFLWVLVALLMILKFVQVRLR
ncbi:MAG: hypothetical protein HKN12_07295, partial [Gemmatimonadetes bacterium]|nr:hypothetical protein [Gemmatimonadota bacterium]